MRKRRISYLGPGVRDGGRRGGTIAILQGDVLAGDELRHQRPQYSREQTLLAAVLVEAIASASGHVPSASSGTNSSIQRMRQRQKTIQREAQAWIWSNREDSPKCFTFKRICGELRLDPSYIRRRVRALIARNGRVVTGIGGHRLPRAVRGVRGLGTIPLQSPRLAVGR